MVSFHVENYLKWCRKSTLSTGYLRVKFALQLCVKLVNLCDDVFLTAVYSKAQNEQLPSRGTVLHSKSQSPLTRICCLLLIAVNIFPIADWTKVVVLVTSDCI